MRLALAIGIARTFRAHLVGLFVELLPRRRAPDAALNFARGTGMDDAIGQYLADQSDAAKTQERVLRGAALEYDFTYEWRRIAAQTPLRESAVHGSYSDLMILPPLGGSYDSSPWSPAGLVLVSGVPGVVVPISASGGTLGRRVLVAWNESRVARRAVADAMPFLSRAESVRILIVGGPTAEYKSREPGADIATLLARHKVVASIEHVATAGRDVATILLERATAFEADLIVAGAYGHSRWSEVVFGSTTEKLLRETTLPILISH